MCLTDVLEISPPQKLTAPRADTADTNVAASHGVKKPGRRRVMLEPDDDDVNDDVVRHKRRPPATVISSITFGSAKSRLGSVKARDTPAVMTTTTTATLEASDVRRTLRIGRVIVAKRAATTTTTSDDDDISDICTTKSTA